MEAGWKFWGALSLSAAAAGVFLACGGGSDDDVPAAEEGDGKAPIEVCLDVNNPLCAKVTTEDNDVICYYADKDAEGYPTVLREFRAELANGESCSIVYDEKGRPVTMVAPNGGRFYLEWLSDTRAGLTMVDPTTGEQVNTLLDLEEVDLDEDAGTEAEPEVTRAAAPERGRLRMEVRPAEAAPVGTRASSRAEITSGTIPVRLYLRDCDLLTDAECYVDVCEGRSTKFIDLLATHKGVRISKGVYEVYISKSFGEGSLFLDCAKIVELLETPCNIYGAYGWVVAGIGGILMRIPTLQTEIFGAAVLGIEAVVEMACRYESRCELLTSSDSYYVTLIPRVVSPAGGIWDSNIWGDPVYVDLSKGAIADMEVRWGGEPYIASVKLDPPAPTSDYIATADLRCIPKGSTIELRVVGTDDYDDSVRKTVTDDAKNYTVSLIVPEAWGGIKDRCTVTVTTPDGKRITKTASLMFQYQ